MRCSKVNYKDPPKPSESKKKDSKKKPQKAASKKNKKKKAKKQKESEEDEGGQSDVSPVSRLSLSRSTFLFNAIPSSRRHRSRSRFRPGVALSMILCCSLYHVLPLCSALSPLRPGFILCADLCLLLFPPFCLIPTFYACSFLCPPNGHTDPYPMRTSSRMFTPFLLFEHTGLCCPSSLNTSHAI